MPAYGRDRARGRIGSPDYGRDAGRYAARGLPAGGHLRIGPVRHDHRETVRESEYPDLQFLQRQQIPHDDLWRDQRKRYVQVSFCRAPHADCIFKFAGPDYGRERGSVREFPSYWHIAVAGGYRPAGGPERAWLQEKIRDQ